MGWVVRGEAGGWEGVDKEAEGREVSMGRCMGRDRDTN